MSEKAIALIDTTLDLNSLGNVLAKSGYFSDTRDAAQAIVKVLAGQELGIGPITAMTGIYIVKGRVTLSANLIAATIKRSERYNYRVMEHTEKQCVVEFYESGESIGTSAFSMQDAQQASLGGDNWRKYPRNMLFARALSNGAKWFCPDIFGGPIYTPDELGADVDGETGEIVTVQARQPLNEIEAEEQRVLASIGSMTDAQVTNGTAALYEPNSGKPTADEIRGWLVTEGIMAANDHIKHVEAFVKLSPFAVAEILDKTTFLEWAHLYRQHRTSGLEPKEAAQLATKDWSDGLEAEPTNGE
ncbi:MAG TPA: hypothetical protein VGC99_10555 [Candidatus Tectomicrobia bacterium]